MVEHFSVRAVERLGELVESPNEAVALGAIRTLLDRAFPIPRQPPALALNVEIGSQQDHMRAMLAFARKRLEGQGVSVSTGEAAVITVAHGQVEVGPVRALPQNAPKRKTL